VDSTNEVSDSQTALQGALDIVAEQWSEDPSMRTWLTSQALNGGRIASRVKRGKQEEASKFELYVDHREPARRIPSHRLLAMLRGQDEGVLKVEMELDDDLLLAELKPKLVRNGNFEFRQELLNAVDD